MELNRNQYFFLGVVVVLLGIQLRVVQEFVLTEEATLFLAERLDPSSSEGKMVSLSSSVGMGQNKVIHPPEWMGWCLISMGAVLILHSLAMPRPG
ncbi:MAG: hypothetical protein ABGX16_06935 [Pirellulales bacterium]